MSTTHRAVKSAERKQGEVIVVCDPQVCPFCRAGHPKFINRRRVEDAEDAEQFDLKEYRCDECGRSFYE